MIQFFLQTLVLLGALQGLISGGLLLGVKPRKLSYRLLAALILVIALANLNVFFLYQTLTPFWQKTGDVLPLLLFMPVGPLLFFYIKATLDNQDRLKGKDIMHFIPVVLDLVPYAAGALFHAGLINNPFIFIEQYDVYVDIPRWVSLTSYCIMSAKIIRNYHSSDVFIAKQVLLSFCIFQIIWLLFLCIYIIPGYRPVLINSAGWFPLYVPLSALIYWIGINGFISIRTANAGRRSSSGSQLAPGVVESVLDRLRDLMEKERPYLDPALNLNRVSELSGLSPKVISSVLNQYLQSNFSEFVNGYRVEACKQKLMDPDLQVYSIKGLAIDCGFSSLATFQRVFKQMTGLSPSDFRNNAG